MVDGTLKYAPTKYQARGKRMTTDKVWDSVPPRGKTRYYSTHETVQHGRTFQVTVKRLEGDDMSLRELLLGVIIQVISHCEDNEIDFDELVDAAVDTPRTNLLNEEVDDEDGDEEGWY